MTMTPFQIFKNASENAKRGVYELRPCPVCVGRDGRPAGCLRSCVTLRRAPSSLTEMRNLKSARPRWLVESSISRRSTTPATARTSPHNGQGLAGLGLVYGANGPSGITSFALRRTPSPERLGRTTHIRFEEQQHRSNRSNTATLLTCIDVRIGGDGVATDAG